MEHYLRIFESPIKTVLVLMASGHVDIWARRSLGVVRWLALKTHRTRRMCGLALSSREKIASRRSCSNEKGRNLRACIVGYGMGIAWQALDDWDRSDNAKNLEYTCEKDRNTNHHRASLYHRDIDKDSTCVQAVSVRLFPKWTVYVSVSIKQARARGRKKRITIRWFTCYLGMTW